MIEARIVTLCAKASLLAAAICVCELGAEPETRGGTIPSAPVATPASAAEKTPPASASTSAGTAGNRSRRKNRRRRRDRAL